MKLRNLQIRRPLASTYQPRAVLRHRSSKSRATIGIDLGGTSVKVALVNTDREVVSEREQPITDRSSNAVLRLLYDISHSLVREFPSIKIIGTGIIAPGSIDYKKGVIRSSANFAEWKDVEVTQFFATREVPQRTFLENDGNGFTLGTWRHDFQAKPDNLIGITLGTGVGSGIVLNRHLLHGEIGVEGEIGHLIIDRNAKLACGCKGTGHLETYASAAALTQYYRSHHGSAKDGGQLAEYARNGDSVAKMAFERLGQNLAYGVSAYVSLLGVRTFSLGGKGAQSFDLFGDAMMTTLRKQLPYVDVDQKLNVLASPLGERAAKLGAASLPLLDE